MPERARLGHNTTPAYWAEQISARWQDAAQSIIDTGLLLLDAKEALRGQRGAWGEMFEPGAKTRLPFGHSTANKLMAIANKKVLIKSEHVPKLPPSWSTQYELTKLPDDALEAKFDDDTINPEMTRDEAVALVEEVSDEGLYVLWHVNESLGVLEKFMGEYPDPASIASRVYNVMVEEPLPPGLKHQVSVDQIGELVEWVKKLHAACQKEEERDELHDLERDEEKGRLREKDRSRLAELRKRHRPTEREEQMDE